MEASPYAALISHLLAKRGVVEPADIGAFLSPDYDLHTHSPLLFAHMERALQRLFLALERGERIAIYADFDCDGIPGAAVLHDFLKKVGHENFEVYLPHRDREGYGFHNEAIAELASRGATLIITVDVGTTAVEGVRYAKEKGIDVIVTDHHEIPGALPDAVAILNPKLSPYPFAHLCGAAVAFKLAHAALIEGKRRGIERFTAIPDGWEKWLLDMVAIATVADMVPLIGENRVLAYWGFQVLRKSPRPGIGALCSLARVKKHELTEDDVGFSLAPRINAASRMDEPQLAFTLLTTQDAAEAEKLAAHLEELNASRKGVVGSIVREAKKSAKQRYSPEEKVVVLGNPDWKPALLGLAANSIMEERGGLVCLWGRDALGRLKGSCRSDGGVSVVDVFKGAADMLVEYGGHERSGGFSVSHEQVHELPGTFARVSGALIGQEQVAQVRAEDFVLALPEVSMPLYREVSRLAPFGIGNPKPTFRISSLVVTDVRRFGKEKNHVELLLECRRTGARSRAFDFFRSPEDFTHEPVQGKEASVLATIERDTYRGGLALRLADVLAA